MSVIIAYAVTQSLFLLRFNSVLLPSSNGLLHQSSDIGLAAVSPSPSPPFFFLIYFYERSIVHCFSFFLFLFTFYPMANDKQHGFISRTVGLSLGFLGIVGLVLSLVSLLPVNFYNIFVAVTALTQVLRHENDWWALSSEGTLYAVFLTGAILSSLITIAMVLVTACRQRPHDAQMAAASAAVEHDIEGKRRSSVWLSRMGGLIFVGQISWALFGKCISGKEGKERARVCECVWTRNKEMEQRERKH